MTTLVKAHNDSFNKLIDSIFLGNVQEQSRKHFEPQVDIAELEDAFKLYFTLPGMQKEDIDISVEESVLSISGERKFEKDEKVKYHRLESTYGKFKRAFNLPKEVDTEKIEATFENGILTLSLPKQEEVSKKLKIAVQ